MALICLNQFLRQFEGLFTFACWIHPLQHFFSLDTLFFPKIPFLFLKILLLYQSFTPNLTIPLPFFIKTNPNSSWGYQKPCGICSHPNHSYPCCCLATKSSTILCNPMDCSPPGSSLHGISQARILEWVAIPFSRVSSQPRDQTPISCISCLAGVFCTTEPPGKPLFLPHCFHIPTPCNLLHILLLVFYSGGTHL